MIATLLTVEAEGTGMTATIAAHHVTADLHLMTAGDLRKTTPSTTVDTIAMRGMLLTIYVPPLSYCTDYIPTLHAHDIDAVLLLAATTEPMIHAITTMAHKAEAAVVEGVMVGAHLHHHLGTSHMGVRTLLCMEEYD